MNRTKIEFISKKYETCAKCEVFIFCASLRLLHHVSLYGTNYTMIIQDNLIMNERSLVPHWFGMDVSLFLGIN